MSNLPPKETILIVDDNEDDIFLFERSLRSAGYITVSADTVPMGIKQAQRCAPHVVVLDLHIGKESGIDFIQQSASVAELKKVPIILLSGESNRSVLAQVEKMGVYQILKKPVAPTQLISAINRCTSQRVYPHVRFDQPKIYASEFKVHAELLAMASNSLQLRLSAKLKEEVPVSIANSFLQECGVSELSFQSKNTKPVRSGENYLNDVKILGISDLSRQKIEKTLRLWKKMTQTGR